MRLLSLLILSLILLVGCTEVKLEPVPVYHIKRVGKLDNEYITNPVYNSIYEVEIDDKTYYATRVEAGWSLCPKVE